MKLSEAILLGDTLKKANAGTWISEDGSCGCALGGALLASGITAKQFGQGYTATSVYCRVFGKRYGVLGEGVIAEMDCVKRLWPWVTPGVVLEISRMYMALERGYRTIEEIAEYVSKVEPAEKEEESRSFGADAAPQDDIQNSALAEVPDEAAVAPAWLD